MNTSKDQTNKSFKLCPIYIIPADIIQSLANLLKEMLPEVIDPLLNINSSFSLGYVPKTFKLAMIKSLVKKKMQYSTDTIWLMLVEKNVILLFLKLGP